MRFFFRSPRFKAMMAAIAIILVVTIGARLIGGWIAPQASIAGAIAAPFQKLFGAISNQIEDITTAFTEGQQLMEENAALEEEVRRLTSQVIDYQKTKEENAFYKDFLELKEQNPDFQFEPAMLISRDTEDPFGGFTIDKGSLSGVAVNDPVITADGLVGYVSEVAPSYSKVTTVLDQKMRAGAYDRRTRDAGIASGTIELAENGQCRLYNLPRSSGVNIGDYVVTSGGGLFPDGLLIGTVADVRQEEQDISVYAVIDPATDIAGLRDVMVLTYFSGQGDPLTGGE